MKFKDFMESEYMKSHLAIQEKEEAYEKAKRSAASEIINAQHVVFKFAAKLELLGKFLLIKLHLIKPGKSAMEQFKEAQEKNMSLDVPKKD